jgi:fatty-acyl-CoA synthase
VEHNRDLASYIDSCAAHRPEAVAIEFEDRSSTYLQLSNNIETVANGLYDLGVRRTNRVAWLGHNHPLAIEILFACSRLGAIYLPLNSRLTVAEHQWILDDASPTVLVAETDFIEHANAALIASELNVCTSADLYSTSPSAPRTGEANDDVLLAYTSGTTGRPKGAVLTQKALVANAVNATHAHDFSSNDRVLTLLPLFHVGGLNIQTLPALFAGAAVLLHRSFDPETWLKDVERWKPTWSLLVPATLNSVSKHPNFNDTDLSSLTGLMTGSSTIPASCVQPFTDRDIVVGQVYGSTETAPTSIHLRIDAANEHPGSCGKPSPLTQLRIVDSEGCDVSPGASGELWVKGPNILSRYWNNPIATQEAITDGWFHTGDIGHQDPDGWVYIDDRKKDMIISGGENIYPAELEEILNDSSFFSEVTVVGINDEQWGEIPIVLGVSASAEKPSDSEIFRLFNNRVAKFKHPKRLIWMTALPRNAMGKVLKHELKAILKRDFDC